MKELYYIPSLTRDSLKSYPIMDNFSARLLQILIEDNNYPTIEHHDWYELFVILLPVYDDLSVHHTIELIECNILIGKENIIFVNNKKNTKIDEIIEKIWNNITYSTLYTLIIQICTYIIETIITLEKVIEKMKQSTIEELWYTAETINTIMKLKLTIGMFRSTIEPLSDVIIHMFDTIKYDHVNIKKDTHFNQIDYLIKQIKAQSNFLYENISIVADTSNAIQNINANNIMKTLTIISSIFIPLSFVTGIFGMNFKDMPWLNDIQRYYITIFGMLFIWLFQLYAFKQKKRF